MSIKDESSVYKKRLLCSNHVFLYGAGAMCRKFLESFCYINKVEGIFDDYTMLEQMQITQPDNAEVYNIAVIKSDEENIFNKLDSYNTLFIITSAQILPIRKRLKNMGFKKVYFAYDFVEFVNKESFEIELLQSPFGLQELELLEKAKKSLSDDLSINIVNKIIKYRKNMQMDYSKIMSNSEQYFERGIINFSEEEVIVDAGAFVGDTLQSFEKHLKHWNKIYCFEPDEANFKLLLDVASNLNNIECICAAAWDDDTKIYFSSYGTIHLLLPKIVAGHLSVQKKLIH